MVKPKPSNNERGFTLVEMSVVITLVALFATLIIPNLVTLKSAQEQMQFVDAAKRMFAQGRDYAIAHNTNVKLSLDSTKMQLNVEDSDTKEKGDEITSIDVLDGVTVNRLQAAGDTKSTSDWDIRFYPDGTNDEGGIEFTIGDLTKAVNITAKGSITLDDELTDTTNDRWTAGTYESR